MRALQTPGNKYMNDPEYHYLVDMLEDLINQARFTPSELREACIFASINYEMKRVRENYIKFDPRVDDALKILDDFVCKRQK